MVSTMNTAQTEHDHEEQQVVDAPLCTSPTEIEIRRSTKDGDAGFGAWRYLPMIDEREVQVPRIVLTPPHSPVPTFLDLDLELPHDADPIVLRHPRQIRRSRSLDRDCSSASSSPSLAHGQRDRDDWTQGDAIVDGGGDGDRPSTRASVWASISALISSLENDPIISPSPAFLVSASALLSADDPAVSTKLPRGRSTLGTGASNTSEDSSGLEMRSKRGARQASRRPSPPAITVSTIGVRVDEVAEGEEQAGSEGLRGGAIKMEEDGSDGSSADQGVGLGIGLGTGNQTTDWSARSTGSPSPSSSSQSAPPSPTLEKRSLAVTPHDRSPSKTSANGPPSPSLITRSPTMPNLTMTQFYYGSVPTTPSPLGRFCTVVLPTGDVLEKVPDGRYPTPCPPTPTGTGAPGSPLSPSNPVPKRRKSAGGELKMSSMVTARSVSLLPLTVAMNKEGGDNMHAYSGPSASYNNGKETWMNAEGPSYLLPLSNKSPSRRSRVGSRSPLYILLLPLMVMILHVYLSHVDKRFMDRGRSLIFGAPMRNHLAQLPDWLMKDVREEVFGQREDGAHGIWLLQHSEDEHEDHEEVGDGEHAWQAADADATVASSPPNSDEVK